MNYNNDTPAPNLATPALGTPAPEIPAPAPAPAPAPSKKSPRTPKVIRVPTAPKKKKTLPPPTRMTDAGYGALRTLKATNPEMSHTQIVSAALIAMATKSAFLQPIQLKRICKENLLILTGIVADIEAALKDTFRKIIRAKIDPIKKAILAEEVDARLMIFIELRQTICREAGIPISCSLTTDAGLAIVALNQKKEETSNKYLQESYENIIQLLERYRLDTFELPETPGQALTTHHNP